LIKSPPFRKRGEERMKQIFQATIELLNIMNR
jgi:hypothetical protein